MLDRLNRLSNEQETLEEDWENGDLDLTTAEYRARMRDIRDELFELNSQRAEASLFTKMAHQAAREDWQRQIEETREEASRRGLDLRPGSALEAQWDRTVKYLVNDPENSDQDAEWFLKTALDMVAIRNETKGA